MPDPVPPTISTALVPASTLAGVPEPAPPGNGFPAVPGYEVLGLLGSGGMGRVYKARDVRLDRVVALKLMTGGVSEKALARFTDEAKVIAHLRHPNILQVFEVGLADDHPFFAMEYMAGGSLADALGGTPLPPWVAAELIGTLANAIFHAHGQGIVHRDLKPGNILFDTADSVLTLEVAKPGPAPAPRAGAKASGGNRLPSMVPKIADFGLAKRLNDDSARTRPGEVLGTPSYMAPEQAAGERHVGPAADVWALGAILYECLTGRPPFRGPDPFQTIYMVQTLDPVPPGRLVPATPRDLETICLKCLSKDPKRRYASAANVAEDAARFRAGKPIRARPVSSLERTWKLARRHPAWATAVLLGAVLVAGLGVGLALLRAAYNETRTANTQLTEAKAESDASLRVARTAVDRLLVRLDDDLPPVPGADEFRRKGLEDARALYAKLSAARAEDWEGKEYRLRALMKLSDIDRRLGRPDDAAAAADEAAAGYDALAKEFPNWHPYRRQKAEAVNTRLVLHIDRREIDRADALLASIGPDLDRLLAEAPDDRDTLWVVGWLRHNRALVDRMAGRLDAAAGDYRAAIQTREHLVLLTSDEPENAVDLAGSWNNLATIHLLQNRPADALAALTTAEKVAAVAVSQRQQKTLVDVRGNLGLAYQKLGRSAEMVAAYRGSKEAADRLVDEYPSAPDYRLLSARTKMNLALALDPGTDYDEVTGLVREAGVLLDRLAKDQPDNPAVTTLRKGQQEAAKYLATIRPPGRKM